jgi:hypothetical protein
MWHLMSGTTRHGNRHPHTPDSMHSSTRIYPIGTWHSNSTIGTCIIAMISLTLDKFALVKAGFSIINPVHQGPGQSTRHQIIRLKRFAPPGEVVSSRATLYRMTWPLPQHLKHWIPLLLVVDPIELYDEFVGLFLSLGAVNPLLSEVLQVFKCAPPLELLTMPRPALLPGVNLLALVVPFVLNGPTLLILMSCCNCLLALLAWCTNSMR